MDRRAWRWPVGLVAGLAALGALGGAFVVLVLQRFPPWALVPLFATAMLVASAGGLQLYRHGARGAVAAGGAGGWAFVAGFFGAPLFSIIVVQGERALDWPGVAMLLGVAPVVVALLTALVTLFLASGVRRNRARHGLVHAPR